jgi:hypothetical protein
LNGLGAGFMRGLRVEIREARYSEAVIGRSVWSISAREESCGSAMASYTENTCNVFKRETRAGGKREKKREETRRESKMKNG